MGLFCSFRTFMVQKQGPNSIGFAIISLNFFEESLGGKIKAEVMENYMFKNTSISISLDFLASSGNQDSDGRPEVFHFSMEQVSTS